MMLHCGVWQPSSSFMCNCWYLIGQIATTFSLSHIPVGENEQVCSSLVLKVTLLKNLLNLVLKMPVPVIDPCTLCVYVGCNLRAESCKVVYCSACSRNQLLRASEEWASMASIPKCFSVLLLCLTPVVLYVRRNNVLIAVQQGLLTWAAEIDTVWIIGSDCCRSTFEWSVTYDLYRNLNEFNLFQLTLPL